VEAGDGMTGPAEVSVVGPGSAVAGAAADIPILAVAAAVAANSSGAAVRREVLHCRVSFGEGEVCV
jgi:hypothetical protein